MRQKSWRQELDKQATLNAYQKAIVDGAHALACRIRVANSEGKNNLTGDFDAIDKAQQSTNPAT